MTLPVSLLLLLRLSCVLCCPSECTCSQETVDCSRGFLWDIPQNLHVETISLDISYSNLTILPADAFLTLSNLVTLLLHSSAIETVEPDAFSGLPVLSFLDLHNNHISYLHPALFRHNPALATLNLSSNRIHHMTEDIFSKNPVLSHVALTGNPLESPVDWIELGFSSSNSVGERFCQLPHSLNSTLQISTTFDDISLDQEEFKTLAASNIIVYKLENLTWAVLETPLLFPVLCFCDELSTWEICGQEVDSRTACTTPETISKIFAGLTCEDAAYATNMQEEFTSTTEEFQGDVVKTPQETTSTSQTPSNKVYLTMDRNLLVLLLAVAGVLVIIWVVAYFMFFHRRQKKTHRDGPTEVSSSFLPGGSPLSLPDNFAYNPAASSQQCVVPDMLITSRGVSREHIVYSYLNTEEATPSQHLYSEIQD